MSLINEIQEIMSMKDQQEEKVGKALEDLGYRFEMDRSLTTAELVEAVSLLLDYALHETSQSLRDDLFNVIDMAVLYRHIGDYEGYPPGSLENSKGIERKTAHNSLLRGIKLIEFNPS